MKGAVGMHKTTGSKRISVIIEDKKGRYLIAERLEMEEKSLEFPGFSCKGAKMADDDEYPFYHYIYRVSSYSGNPQKGYYSGIYWKHLNDMDVESLKQRSSG